MNLSVLLSVVAWASVGYLSYKLNKEWLPTAAIAWGVLFYPLVGVVLSVLFPIAKLLLTYWYVSFPSTVLFFVFTMKAYPPTWRALAGIVIYAGLVGVAGTCGAVGKFMTATINWIIFS